MLKCQGDEISRVDDDIRHDSNSPRVDLNLFRQNHVFFVKNSQEIGLSDLILVENLPYILPAYGTVALALRKPKITLVHFERQR